MVRMDYFSLTYIMFSLLRTVALFILKLNKYGFNAGSIDTILI